MSVWGATDAWAAGDLISTTADLEHFIRALFRGQVVREYGTGEPAAYSAGLSVVKLGGREVWGKTWPLGLQHGCRGHP